AWEPRSSASAPKRNALLPRIGRIAPRMTIRTQLEKLAFLGGGNMGRALIGGLLQQGTRPEAIAVGEAYEPARAALSKEFGISATPDNAAAVTDATIVVLAVKPQDAGNVLAPLAPVLQKARPLLISVCAGLKVA